MNASLMAIIQTLVLPPLSLFLLYGAGWMLRCWWPRFGRVVSGAAIVLLFVLCTNAGAWLLLRPLESLEPPLQSASGAEAIVVLSAGRLENSPEYGGRDIPDYVALARARYAAKLQRETGLPLLVSGGRRTTDGPDESLANGMARALQEDFATPVRWVEDNSANTAENAAFSAQILKHAGVRRILLVTDAMHMRRARVAFAREGLEVIGAPTMFFSRDRWSPLDFLPGAEGLRRSRYAIYEWLGMAWYGLQYALVRTAEADIH
jgi:uncharacterized SAM-binding protein YcdF (DUF218 family)